MKPTKIATLLFLFFMIGIEVAYCGIFSAPTQIQLQGGSEDRDGNWLNGYWHFVVDVYEFSSMAGIVTLPANTTEGEEETGQKRTKAAVTLEVTPLEVKYVRELKEADINDRLVYPDIHGTGLSSLYNIFGLLPYPTNDHSIPAFIADYYVWAPDSWMKFTSFRVRVLVDEKEVANEILSGEDFKKDVAIDVQTKNGVKQLILRTHGRLEGDQTEPDVGNIVFFNENAIYGEDAIPLIHYDHGREKHAMLNAWATHPVYWNTYNKDVPFATYRYGETRWMNQGFPYDDTPAAVTHPAHENDYRSYVLLDGYKGWKSAGGFPNDMLRIPVEATYDDLFFYLNKTTSRGNIAGDIFTGFNGWRVIYEGDKPKAIEVSAPWGALSGTPTLEVLVPSELVETWVFYAPLADFRVVDAVWQPDCKIPDAGHRNLTLTLQQFAQTTSSAVVEAESLTDRAEVKCVPATITGAYGEKVNVTIQVLNLGVEENITGKLAVRVRSTWNNEQTFYKEYSYMLLEPKLKENLPEVIDRGKEPEETPVEVKTISEGDSENPLMYPAITIVACTAIICATVFIIKRPNEAKGIAKSTVKTTKKMAKPIWEAYPRTCALFLMSIIVFGGAMIWRSFFPSWRLMPFDLDIGWPLNWHVHAGIVRGLVLVVSFITAFICVIKLVWSEIPEPVQKTVALVSKKRSVTSKTSGRKTKRKTKKKKD